MSVLSLLLSFDRSIKQQHPELTIIGVDEVGRGCLAGPVTAAATVFPELKANSKLGKQLSQLNDSKKLNAEQRSRLFAVISKNAHFAIASATVEEINDINILQASYLAMKRAIAALMEKLAISVENTLVLVDGKQKIPDNKLRQLSVIKGDGCSAAIAAASIMAKVHRDQFMTELAKSFPHYQWQQNKGYGSASHRQAILKHGSSIWHRRVFIDGMLDSDEMLEEN